MQPSKDCLYLTEKSEGCRLKAYQDTGGVWTIGYGHTNGVQPNQTITQAMAEVLLKHDMEYASKFVEQHAGVCTQGQFDALTDFVFNVGPSQFLSSHLYRYHTSGQYEKAAAEFPKWKYDNGKVEPGLVARRSLEQALYSRQAPSGVRPHTDELGHSVEPTVGSVPAGPERDVAPPSPVPSVPVSGTAPVSGIPPSEFLSQASALLRRLIGK